MTSVGAFGRPSRSQFLLASDLHFDPLADPAIVPDLMKVPATEWESIFARSTQTRFSQYGSDPNWWLLESSLDAMHATLPHPAFIMVTGDLLAHQFPQTFQKITHDNDREHYRSFVGKTVQFIALELRKRFGKTPILLAIGNNDENCGNYSIRPGGLFLGDTAELARSLAHADNTFVADWKALGSYNIANPAIPHLRILSLNTVFFSAKYRAASFYAGCSGVASDGAQQLMTWLAANLAKAQQAHEKVWLMLHIPPGIDGYYSTQKYVSLMKGSSTPNPQLCSQAVVPMWVPEWTRQFEDLMEKYHDVIIGGFAGHTHTDDFRLIGSPGQDQVFILVDPAVSPVYFQNPAFRVVNFSGKGNITNQTTYYLTNLEKASTEVKGVWRREYSFDQAWNAKQLDAASLDKIYREAREQQPVLDQWFKLYNVSILTDASVPFSALRGFYCADGALDVADYQTCFCQRPTGSSTAAGSSSN